MRLKIQSIIMSLILLILLAGCSSGAATSTDKTEASKEDITVNIGYSTKPRTIIIG